LRGCHLLLEVREFPLGDFRFLLHLSLARLRLTLGGLEFLARRFDFRVLFCQLLPRLLRLVLEQRQLFNDHLCRLPQSLLHVLHLPLEGLEVLASRFDFSVLLCQLLPRGCHLGLSTVQLLSSGCNLGALLFHEGEGGGKVALRFAQLLRRVRQLRPQLRDLPPHRNEVRLLGGKRPALMFDGRGSFRRSLLLLREFLACELCLFHRVRQLSVGLFHLGRELVLGGVRGLVVFRDLLLRRLKSLLGLRRLLLGRGGLLRGRFGNFARLLDLPQGVLSRLFAFGEFLACELRLLLRLIQLLCRVLGLSLGLGELVLCEFRILGELLELLLRAGGFLVFLVQLLLRRLRVLLEAAERRLSNGGLLLLLRQLRSQRLGLGLLLR